MQNCRWLTTVHGYLRLLLFGKNVTKAPQAKLHRVTSYIVSVYAPMFFKINLNPGAPEGPTNVLCIRDFLLDFSSEDTMLMEQSVKTIFVKHFNAWMNPTTEALPDESQFYSRSR